jgi:RNA polymerase II C-terminal domain phosphatase-like 3/4
VDGKTGISISDQKTGPASSPEVVAASSHSQNTWKDVEHLFEGYDDQQKAAIQRERARRLEEQKKMFAARKLCLVLDLDHTLLNSAKAILSSSCINMAFFPIWDNS